MVLGPTGSTAPVFCWLQDFYTSRYDYTLIRDWGMYVMISKFADCNGNNVSIPDGIPVDLEAKDNPLDGYQLGDENETMLRAALQAAGKTYPKSASVNSFIFKGHRPHPS